MPPARVPPMPRRLAASRSSASTTFPMPARLPQGARFLQFGPWHGECAQGRQRPGGEPDVRARPGQRRQLPDPAQRQDDRQRQGRRGSHRLHARRWRQDAVTRCACREGVAPTGRGEACTSTIRSISTCRLAASGPRSANGTSAGPSAKVALVNHISYTCPDFKRAADWYSKIFNLDQVGASDRDVTLPFGKPGEQPYGVTANDVPLPHLIIRTRDPDRTGSLAARAKPSSITSPTRSPISTRSACAPS